jgi:hypothetical protein
MDHWTIAEKLAWSFGWGMFSGWHINNVFRALRSTTAPPRAAGERNK